MLWCRGDAANPPVGGFCRRTTRPVVLGGVCEPEGRVVLVALASSNRSSSSGATDLDPFRSERHLEGGAGATLLPFGGGERVCLGQALAELKIRLMAVGLLQQVVLDLATAEDLGIMGTTLLSLNAPPAVACPGECWPAVEQLCGEEACGSSPLQDHRADHD